MLSPKHGKHVTNLWAYSQSHYKCTDPVLILSSKHVTNVWAYSQSRYKFMDPFPILCLKYCKHMFPMNCSNTCIIWYYCCTCIAVIAYCFTISDQDTSNTGIIENTHNGQNAKCNIQQLSILFDKQVVSFIWKKKQVSLTCAIPASHLCLEKILLTRQIICKNIQKNEVTSQLG